MASDAGIDVTTNIEPVPVDTGESFGFTWQWLGRVDYRAGLAYQRALRDRLLDGDNSAARLLLLEHPRVITLGRNADRRHLLASSEQLVAYGIDVCDVDRGGDVTFHGPGQLMVYPVVRLGAGLVSLLEGLANALAATAAHFGVAGAEWRRQPAGLWLGNAKLAACGVHLRRWVVTHGFSLNVAVRLDDWRLIVPCGLKTAQVTSIAHECARRGQRPPSIDDVARVAAPHLCRVLAMQHRPIG